MKKVFYKIFGLAVLLFVFLIFTGPGQANAAVNVGINFNFGPPPQEIVAVPGDVYFVPTPGVDIFFYSGYWWTIRQNRWYRSHDYNGSWIVVNQRYVPSPVFQVYRTPNYRVHYVQVGRHIPYEKWRSNVSRNNNHGSQGGHGNNGEHGSHR